MLRDIEKTSGIYVVENITNRKKYVGRAINLYQRIAHHKSDLRSGKDCCRVLQSAFNKYGEENFDFYVLELCSEDDLNYLEDFYINFLQTLTTQWGYNLYSGGRSGRRPSDETRRLLSIAGKGRPKSQETKDKMSVAATGKKKSPRSEQGRINTSVVRQGKTKGIKNGAKKTSKYIGVSLRKNSKSNPWASAITHMGKYIHLGSFPTETEAAETYNAKALELFGPNARLNTIEYPVDHYEFDAIDAMYDLQFNGVF